VWYVDDKAKCSGNWGDLKVQFNPHGSFLATNPPQHRITDATTRRKKEHAICPANCSISKAIGKMLVITVIIP